jgi:hypothetical protein
MYPFSLEKKVPKKRDGWGMDIPHPSLFFGDSPLKTFAAER